MPRTEIKRLREENRILKKRRDLSISSQPAHRPVIVEADPAPRMEFRLNPEDAAKKFSIHIVANTEEQNTVMMTEAKRISKRFPSLIDDLS